MGCRVLSRSERSAREHWARAAVWYAWDTMSGINGDKARFNRVRKHKLALRERSQVIRKELAAAAASKTTDAPPPAEPVSNS